ncbi:MAG: DUF3168 domain-containing protein [Pseudonocardiaceae bacterium]
MSTSAQPALQEAVYALLTADATLSALITGVFDEVTTTARPPYIVLADVMEQASEAHDRSGVDLTLTIDIWSTYRGYKECAAINDEVLRLLHRPTPPLIVAGFVNVSIFNESSQFMRDPDPDLRRCITRYRAWLESTE